MSNACAAIAVTEIIAEKVAESERMHFLPRHLGRYMTRFEAAVYATMDNLCKEYEGGYWEFYETTNGAFFMAPDDDREYTVSVSTNCYEGCMSAHAAGVVVCLFVLSDMMWTLQTEESVKRFEALRNYAYEHPESAKIIRAID